MKSITYRPLTASTQNPTRSVPILPLNEQLKLLKPTRELLYYRKRITQLVNEYQTMLEKVERCKNLCEIDLKQKKVLQKQLVEINVLQGAVSDLQVYLYQEREQVLRLYAENDRLKIRSIEDRKKIAFLLSLISSSGGKLAQLLQDSQGCNVNQGNGINLKKFEKKLKQNPEEFFNKLANSSVQKKKAGAGVDTSSLHATTLAAQLEEKTRLYQDQLRTLLQDRDLHRKETAVKFTNLNNQLACATTRLKAVQKEFCGHVESMVDLKKKHCNEELEWLKERDFFIENLERREQIGQSLTNVSHTICGGGALDITKKAKESEIAILKEDLSDRDKMIVMYQEQCIILDAEVTQLKEESQSNQIKFQEQSKRLREEISLYKQRYIKLDKRRRLEAEGFQSDLQQMRNRLRDVERNLLKLSDRMSSSEKIMLDKNVCMSVADTIGKAQQLREELQNIQKKIAVIEKENKS